MYKSCIVCQSRFYKPTTRSVADFKKRAKYCSKECKHKGWVGRKPYNAGKTRAEDSRIAQPWLNKSRDENTMQKLQEGRKKVKGENHPLWQKKPTYRAIHGYINKYWVKAGVCEFCKNAKNKSGKTQWANKENYDRMDREDWYELCSSCHKTYDLAKLTYTSV